jgi:hypothetical protein
MTFEEANKVVHKVEDQWHYPTLTAKGFIPETKTAVGFVRSYDYAHPKGHKIRCSTGANADHWEDLVTRDIGYHYSLKSHLDKLVPARFYKDLTAPELALIFAANEANVNGRTVDYWLETKYHDWKLEDYFANIDQEDEVPTHELAHLKA